MIYIKQYIIHIIKLIHFSLILFIICAPFYNKDYLLKTIFIVSIIYYKWKINGSCFFTQLEYSLMKKKKEEEGFIYRLINPLLNINTNEKIFNYNLEYLTLSWFFILILIYVIRFL